MASNQFLSLFLLLCFFLPASISPAVARGLPGGYRPIEDPNDPYVVAIAAFAVDEHNKEASDKLQFVKIQSGRYQIVAGVNYDLDIVASANNAQARYKAVVYDKPWAKERSLTSFTKE